MARESRAFLSVSKALFKALELEAKRRGIPISRLVELAIGPTIGLELELEPDIDDRDIKPSNIH